MATPLTDSINALTRYANETTGASDTTLSDAVETLVAGYGESGSSSTWIKIAEKSYTIENFTGAAQIVETWKTGHSEIWTSDKIVYVRIRDTVGKRAGYFYGTDTFFINPLIKDGSSLTDTQSQIISAVWSVDSTSLYKFMYGYNTTSYGVYPDNFFNNGDIRIIKKYNSSHSRTIDGTYKVEVYLLDPAGGVPIFE